MPAEIALPCDPTPSIADTSQDQMVPTFEQSEIERGLRFEEPRTFAAGKFGERENLVRAMLRSALRFLSLSVA